MLVIRFIDKRRKYPKDQNNPANQERKMASCRALSLLDSPGKLYLLAKYSKIEGNREIKFRSQDNFRLKLVESLVDAGKDAKVLPKRNLLHISLEGLEVPVHQHQHIKMTSRKDCVACKGVRHGDRPPKRVALAQIAANQGAKFTRRSSWFSCKQYDVTLYRKGGCFKGYHQNI
jgi:hypothetical protein